MNSDTNMVKDTYYYDVLGVKPNAPIEKIKQAYRQLALRYHPDKNPDGTEQIQTINMIYEILKDEDARRNYDLYGDARHLTNYNPDECCDVVEHTEHLSLEKIYIGGTIPINVKRYIRCRRCKSEAAPNTCDECDGVPRCEQLSYDIKFAPGVPSNFSQQYELCEDEYIPVLLTVNISQLDHRVYQRIHNSNLVMQMKLNVFEAFIHLDKIFTTIDSRIVHIAKNPGETTNELEKMIVKGEGLPYFGDHYGKRGDLIIFCRIDWQGIFSLQTAVNFFRKTKTGSQMAGRPVRATEILINRERPVFGHFECTEFGKKFHEEFIKYFEDPLLAYPVDPIDQPFWMHQD